MMLCKEETHFPIYMWPTLMHQFVCVCVGQRVKRKRSTHTRTHTYLLPLFLRLLFLSSFSRAWSSQVQAGTCTSTWAKTRSIATNEWGPLWRCQLLLASSGWAALMGSNGYWPSDWFIEPVISALYQHLQRMDEWQKDWYRCFHSAESKRYKDRKSD